MDILILLGLWGALILLGYVFGRMAEAKHYRSIVEREKATLPLPATNARVPMSTAAVARSELVTGSVVISVDHFKRALAALRSLVGGPVKSYETLLDRARREAVLRLKESCPGAHEIVNLRLETVAISKNGSNGIGSIETLAYGTAIYFESRIDVT
jgi:uncharacterized protein YbjQ (UPF0145 family)